MSSGILKLKLENDQLKKDLYDSFQENRKLSKLSEKFEQILVEEKQIRSIEINVLYDLVYSLQQKNVDLENYLISLKTKIIVNEEKQVHTCLSVTKLLFKHYFQQLDKRLFDLDQESRVDYLSNEFECTLVEAEKIWKLFEVWK